MPSPTASQKADRSRQDLVNTLGLARQYTQAGGMEGLAAVLVPLAGYAAVLLSVRYLNRHDD
ncbi:hypothetical protein, partial [Mycobacteroides abscessus]